METEIASFFNEISLKKLDEIQYSDMNDICIKSDELFDLFECQKNQIKSKINPTGRKLFSRDRVDLILKSIPADENHLKTQTEYIRPLA